MNTCIISTFNRKKGSSSPLLETGGGGARGGAGVGGGCRAETMQCATLTSLLEATRTLQQHREGFNLCSPGALTRHQPWSLLSTSGREAARAHWAPWPGSRAGCFLGFVCETQCPSRQAPWNSTAGRRGNRAALRVPLAAPFLSVPISCLPHMQFAHSLAHARSFLSSLPPSSSVRETSEGYCLACLFLHYLSCRGQSQTSRGQS